MGSPSSWKASQEHACWWTNSCWTDVLAPDASSASATALEARARLELLQRQQRALRPQAFPQAHPRREIPLQEQRRPPVEAMSGRSGVFLPRVQLASAGRLALAWATRQALGELVVSKRRRAWMALVAVESRSQANGPSPAWALAAILVSPSPLLWALQRVSPRVRVEGV